MKKHFWRTTGITLITLSGVVSTVTSRRWKWTSGLVLISSIVWVSRLRERFERVILEVWFDSKCCSFEKPVESCWVLFQVVRHILVAPKMQVQQIDLSLWLLSLNFPRSIKKLSDVFEFISTNREFVFCAQFCHRLIIILICHSVNADSAFWHYFLLVNTPSNSSPCLTISSQINRPLSTTS